MLGLLVPGLGMGAGGAAAEEVGGGWAEAMDIFVPGFEMADTLSHADRIGMFVPGFDQAEIT